MALHRMFDTLMHIDQDALATPHELASLIRQKSFERMQLQPGDHVLDVGCGTGADTLAMARLVGAGGTVAGVDYDSAMIAQARRRARAEDVAAAVRFHHANATVLPWQDNYFNACRSDRIFQHTLDPANSFDEMLRVTQPGGRVVVVDGDWMSLGIDEDGNGNDIDIEAQHQHFLATLHRDNRVSGAGLRQLFMSRGLRDTELEVLPLFAIVDDVAVSIYWQQSCSSEASNAGLFASANALIISGRKA